MKKKIEEIKTKKLTVNREMLYVFGFSFFFLYMLFSVFLNHSFISDHVKGTLSEPYEVKWPNIAGYLSGGRVVSYFLIGIVGWCLDKINISKWQNQYVLQFITIILLAIAVCLLYSIFKKFFESTKEKMVLPLLLVITFGNSFFGETFVYVGYELAVAIILAILAVNVFVKKKYIFATILVFLSCSVYQSYIEIFLIYATLYVYMDGKGTLELRRIWEHIKVAIVAGIAVFANLYLVRISVVSGVSNSVPKPLQVGNSIIDWIWKMINVYKRILALACGYYPRWFLFLLVLAIGVGIVVFLIMKKKNIWDILYFVAFYVVMNLFYVVIFAVTDGWTPQRMSWPFFCALSSLFVVCLYFFKEEIWRRILSSVIICFMIVNIYYTQTAVTDFYISNKLDMQIIASVEAEIERYEAETGNTVTTIATKLATDADDVYSDMMNLDYMSASYAIKVISISWSDVELLNYLTNSNYKESVMPDEIYNKYFSDVKYDAFVPEEQLVFEGDTLYWLIY